MDMVSPPMTFDVDCMNWNRLRANRHPPPPRLQVPIRQVSLLADPVRNFGDHFVAGH